jgi:outer membrane receptor protein involved in Fe transport
MSAQAVIHRLEMPELHIDGADPANHGQFIEEFYSLLVKNEHEWNSSFTSILSLEGLIRDQARENRGGQAKNAVEITSRQRSIRGEAGLRYTGLDRHLIQAGVQGACEDNYDTYFTFLAADQEGMVPATTLVDKDTTSVGVYLDDEFHLNDQWKLIAGVRADTNGRLENDRWYPGWRSAAVYHPKESWVSKAVFNRSVRMPSPLQSLNKIWGSNNPTDHPGNLDFSELSPTVTKPERLTTVEWQNIFYVKQTRLGTTLYYQELEDFITWFQPHSNGGDFSGHGIELNLESALTPSATLWANAAWNDSELDLFRPEVFGTVNNEPENFHAYVDQNNRIIGSAQYTANLGLDCEVVSGVTFSPALRYFTEQAAVEFKPVEEGGPEIITIRNRVYADASLVWNKAKPVNGVGVSVRLSGYNLTDNQDRVGGQLFGDTYRPRGRSGVISLHLTL